MFPRNSQNLLKILHAIERFRKVKTACSHFSLHHIFESEKFRFPFFLWKITQPGELFIKKGIKTETVTVLTVSITLQFADGVDRGALGNKF